MSAAVHIAGPRLLGAHGRVRVALVGCGGNGSQMLTGLARLNHALVNLGHAGLHVTAFDGDTVSESNIGRQMFSPADVGQYKSVVLVHRLNAFFGLDWHARAMHAGPDEMIRGGLDLTVLCVDSIAARASLATWLKRAGGYVMDLGNRASDGQVILGSSDNAARVEGSTALRWPYDVLPELVDTSLPEDTTPSCGLAEALERQELFINQAIVTPALAILWELFRRGRISWCGAFVNLKTGHVRPLPVDNTK
ncbi:PRTRC genetic system ThiF family protein [Paraburkholderia bannensis]|uniref:PRTRC genetic system ThiF family protein n=1 Tax=Paraburkholderia bannensis TaxID=765414 RepID=A0A7W9U1B8_9BURK|nr:MULTISPECIES: PRTRC system ThiF family protein [Paraburkholderia]MBB3259967.1 PRTRC genetic system ThiF family protein [Paraburkholderia sp. WP4_3_2]MBB6105173.1 PRTRC genetic system ThiF family protein [Paraburkholderia bannensis]